MLSPKLSGKLIASNSKHVTILKEGIEKVASLITEKYISNSGILSNVADWLSIACHPKPDASACDWIFLVDSINFSFWYDNVSNFTVTYAGESFTGYPALCACVNRALDAGIPLTDPSFYSSLSTKDMHSIFADDHGNLIPMINERQANLNESGNILLNKFSGSFRTCVEQCNSSADRLIDLVVKNFPCFRDTAIYEGVEVAFLKRAQLLVSDLWCCFRGQGFGNFTDIDKLSMFADYRVPQVLVYFGVLKYSPELEDRLLRGSIFLPGEDMEIEIRGCSIEAVEMIVELANQKLQREGYTNYQNLNACVVDNFLWLYRRENARQLSNIPFHKTRSIFY